MRTIGVVTGSRADYGIYRPILDRIQDDPDLGLQVFVTGMHLDPTFGLTVRGIEADGFPIAERIDALLASDRPEGLAKSMGLGLIGFGQAFARCRPDIVLVLGDRFEMFAAAAAALPFNLPLAHVHGGELSEGAIDDALRHALTKMCHLHFVTTPRYAQRVIQLGEAPWRVTVSGAPGLDNLHRITYLSREALARQVGVPAQGPFLLVTYHPVTREHAHTEWQVGELLAALETAGLPVLLTGPNADTGNRTLLDRIHAFAARNRKARVITHLGTQAYFSLMRHASAMVGNSSSGIIEAASFKLPVVNIGTRQQGRLRPANVIDTGYRRQDIVEGLETALSPAFRNRLVHLVNPYGDGQAAARIVDRLKQVTLDQTLLQKRFYDLEHLPPGDLSTSGPKENVLKPAPQGADRNTMQSMDGLAPSPGDRGRGRFAQDPV